MAKQAFQLHRHAEARYAPADDDNFLGRAHFAGMALLQWMLWYSLESHANVDGDCDVCDSRSTLQTSKCPYRTRYIVSTWCGLSCPSFANSELWVSALSLSTAARSIQFFSWASLHNALRVCACTFQGASTVQKSRDYESSWLLYYLGLSMQDRFSAVEGTAWGPTGSIMSCWVQDGNSSRSPHQVVPFLHLRHHWYHFFFLSNPTVPCMSVENRQMHSTRTRTRSGW
jgi:hypothetical protein